MLGKLKEANIRAEVNASGDRMQAKIRLAQMQKIPYMLIVGDREAEAGAVALRLRTGENLGAQPLAGFVEMARQAISERK